MKFAQIIPAVALVLAPVAVSAQIPGPPGPAPATLSVSGEGLVQRLPDIARVNVQIVTNDDDAGRSAGKNSDIYNALKAKLAPLGIAGDALTTSYFYVNFVPRPPKGTAPEQAQPRYGYVTSRSVAVAVAPIENVGKVVDAATAAGVTAVGDVSFELKDRRAAYREALAAAIDDAKRNAAAVAAAGAFTLVRFRNVSATGIAPGPYAGVALKGNMMAAPAPQPPTELGNGGPISVSARVSVTYDIR